MLPTCCVLPSPPGTCQWEAGCQGPGLEEEQGVRGLKLVFLHQELHLVIEVSAGNFIMGEGT